MALEQRPWLLGAPEHGVFWIWETISTATKQCHCSIWSLVMGKLWRYNSTAFCKNVPEVSNSFLRSTQFFPHLPCLKSISSPQVSALGRVDWLQPNCVIDAYLEFHFQVGKQATDLTDTIQQRGKSVIHSSKASWSVWLPSSFFFFQFEISVLLCP